MLSQKWPNVPFAQFLHILSMQFQNTQWNSRIVFIHFHDLKRCVVANAVCYRFCDVHVSEDWDTHAATMRSNTAMETPDMWRIYFSLFHHFAPSLFVYDRIEPNESHHTHAYEYIDSLPYNNNTSLSSPKFISSRTFFPFNLFYALLYSSLLSIS